MIVRVPYVVMAVLAAVIVPATLGDSALYENPATVALVASAPGTPVQQAYLTMNAWEVLLACAGVFAGMRSAPYGLEVTRSGFRRVVLYVRKEDRL